MYTHPQPPPSPLIPHITSAISSHHPISTQQQPHLGEQQVSFKHNATSLQQLQQVPCPLPTELSTYIDYLGGYYNRRRFPVYFKEGVAKFRVKDFIKVEMIHVDQFLGKLDEVERGRFCSIGRIIDMHKARKSLNLDEFSSLLGTKFFTSVLVEGVPGVGKTTFAWELCWQWKEGKLLKQFDLVLLAQIRTDEMRKAVTMHDIICHPDKTVSEAVIKHLLSTNGRGVLIIVEGYDEASPEQLSKNSIFSKLLERKMLPYATVLVTSRPASSHALPEVFFQSSDVQHIEIIGFTENEIADYIESALLTRPKILGSFKIYLDSNPVAHSLMCVPLHCAIMTWLYAKHWEEGDKDFAPKTMTELYTALVMSLLLRYLSGTTCGKEIVKVTKFSELPEDVYKKLMDLAEIAAEGIEQRRYTFTHLSNETMGLTQKIEEFYPNIGSGVVTHAFLHLTLQEYLAALYWAEISPHQMQELLSREDLFPISKLVRCDTKKDLTSSCSGYHWPVLLFFGGLTHLYHIGAEFLKSKLVDGFYSSFCQLLYEAQNVTLVESIFAHGEFVAGRHINISAMHWYCYGYCIAYSSSTASWEVEMEIASEKSFSCLKEGLKFCQRGRITSMSATRMEILLTLIEIINDHSHTITSLYFSEAVATQAQTSKFTTCFPSLQELSILFCDLNEWRPFLASLSHFSALKCLRLSTDCKVIGSCPPQCVPSMKQLETNVYLPFIVEPNISTLHTLHLYELHSNSDAIALSHALQSPHCHVKVLVFDWYKEQVLSESEVELLQGAAKCKTLSTLDYAIANPSHDVFAALTHLITHHTTLSELVVSDPGDNIVGVLLLVQSMKYSSRKAHLQLYLSTRTIPQARWMEVLSEHSFPRDRITLKF